jgi:Fic family protein
MEELLAEFPADRLLGFRGGVQVPDGISSPPYLHWEELRHRPLPEAVESHRHWWAIAKLRRRINVRHLPLTDEAGRVFSYCLTDSLQSQLWELDRVAAGSLADVDPLLNEQTRDQFLIDAWISEAVTSSQLEGAATTSEVADELLRSGRAPNDHGEQMIFNNYHAVHHCRELEQLTPAAIQELHRILTAGTLENPADAGRLQTSSEPRIVVSDNRSQAVLHRPPRAELLPVRLEMLCRFASGELTTGYLHPLLRAIVLHFWLSYDHPFVDGNGRTARALYYQAIRRARYWLLEYVPISPFLRNAPGRYSEAFLKTESDENDLTYFLEYHLDVITRGVAELRGRLTRRLERIHGIEAALRDDPALNHRQLALLSHALRHPTARYSIATQRTSHRVAYATARADLLGLVERGLLQPAPRGLFEPGSARGKQMLFVASRKLLDLRSETGS